MKLSMLGVIGCLVLSILQVQVIAKNGLRDDEEAVEAMKKVEELRKLAESYEVANGCPKGHKKSWATGVCEVCEPGTYQPHDLSTTNKCTRCTRPGTGSAEGASECIPCDILGSDGKCVEATQANDVTGEVTTNAVNDGPSLAGTGPVTNNPCGTGSTDAFCECDAGEKRSTNDGTTLFCEPCEPGTFLSINSHTSNKCVDCSPGGAASNPGSVECRQCDPGSEAPTKGLTECKLCKPGFFAELAGTPNCLRCFPGSGTGPNEFGSITCPECVPGTFSTDRDGVCRQCQPGTFQPLEGSTGCILCPLGTSEPTSGSSALTCPSCEIGFFQDELGQPACKSCGIMEFNLQPDSVACEPCLAAGVFFGLKHMDQCVITWLIIIFPLMGCVGFCCFRKYRGDRAVSPNVIMVRDSKMGATMGRWRPQSYIPDHWKDRYRASADSFREKYRASANTLKRYARESFQRGGDKSSSRDRDYPESREYPVSRSGYDDRGYDDRSYPSSASSSGRSQRHGPPGYYDDRRGNPSRNYKFPPSL